MSEVQVPILPALKSLAEAGGQAINNKILIPLIPVVVEGAQITGRNWDELIKIGKNVASLKYQKWKIERELERKGYPLWIDDYHSQQGKPKIFPRIKPTPNKNPDPDGETTPQPTKDQGKKNKTPEPPPPRRLKVKTQSKKPDPPTDTQDKPVVELSKDYKNELPGKLIHFPVDGRPTRFIEYDTSEALAEITARITTNQQNFSQWITGEVERLTETTAIPAPSVYSTPSVVMFPRLGISGFINGSDVLEGLADLYHRTSRSSTVNPPSIGIVSQTETTKEMVQLVKPEQPETSLEHVGNSYLLNMFSFFAMPQGYKTTVEDHLSVLGQANITPEVSQQVQNTLNTATGLNTAPKQGGAKVTVNQNQSTSQVLNGQTPPPAVPQTIPMQNQMQWISHALGAIWVRLGLDQFPANLPNPIEPPNDNGEKPTIPVDNVVGQIAVNQANLDQKLGTFPVLIDNTGENGEKDNFKMDNLSTGIAGLATLGLGAMAINNINFNSIANIATTVTGAAAAATKAAGCACAGLDAMGGRKNPICEAQQIPFNFGVAGKPGTNNPIGKVSEWLGGGQGCFPSTVSEQNETLFDMIKDIRFAAQIIKETNFKKASDIDKEEERIKDLFKKIKKTNKERWENFKDAVRKEDSYLNKHYPVKPKIVERGNSQNPSNPTPANPYNPQFPNP